MFQLLSFRVLSRLMFILMLKHLFKCCFVHAKGNQNKFLALKFLALMAVQIGLRDGRQCLANLTIDERSIPYNL